MSRDFVTIVTGVPRSGTSLMMQMLAAGGVAPIHDGIRRPDAHNPRGYFEDERVKRLREDSSWVGTARGSALKVIHALAPQLPQDVPYRVVLVRRPWPEVLASQDEMLRRSGRAAPELPPDRVIAVLEAQLGEVAAWAERCGAPLLEVSYAAVLSDTAEVVASLDAFLGGGLDRDEMSGAVDPALHRQRV